MMGKYGNYVAVIAFIGLLTVYVLLFLQLSLQQLLGLLAAPVVPVAFVVLLALKPEDRRRLLEKALGYETRRRQLEERFYRYQNLAVVLFIALILVGPLVWKYQLIPVQYMALFVLAFFFTIVVLGVVQIVSLLRVAGKWGLVLIVVLTVVAALRVLLR